jgi:hypothetical protein
MSVTANPIAARPFFYEIERQWIHLRNAKAAY